MSDRALRCDGCGKPVLLMTPEQAERVDANPDAFAFTCLVCSGDEAARWPDLHDDA